MENKNIAIAVVVVALIVVGMFGFAYLKKIELTKDTPTDTSDVADEALPYANITRIDAKHFFADGTHTIVGEVLMPTPCDLLNWDTRIAESYPEQVTVSFDVINHSEVCAQVVTPQRFKVSFTASEKASIRATFEGRNVELNLIPASPNESPEDFELFIKG